MPPLTPPPQATPPMGQPGAGMQAQARVELNNAVRGLIRALGMLREVRTDEARAILKALQALEKVTPDVEEAVSNSEMRALLASAQTAPGPGGGGVPGRASTPAPLGPRSPQPMAVAGLPFGANANLPVPGIS